jgi:TolB protein
MNEDGTGWKKIFEFKDYKACGSPAVSPDGKWLAFDAYAVPNGTPTIYVMPFDRFGPPQTVGTGSMPSWAPDSNRLVCSRNDSPSGIWMFAKQENAWTPTNLTEGGWGAQWSPDGKQVLFTDQQALKSYDVEAKTIRDVIEAKVSPYQRIFWNPAFSPDGTHICFKGMTQGGTQDVATFDLTKEKPSVKVRHTGTAAVNADFAWHPTKNRVIFAMYSPDRKTTQLYEFDPTNDERPKLVEGQDPKLNNTDACWTPDGKQLIIISGDY